MTTENIININSAAPLGSLDVAKEARLIRFVVDYRGWVLLFFIWGISLISSEPWASSLWFYGWLMTYLAYQTGLEVLYRINKEFYDTFWPRIVRIQLMILLGSTLVFGTGGVDSYFWPIFLWSLFASIVYFRSTWTVTWIIYIEVVVGYSLSLLLTVGGVASPHFDILLANLVILFVLTMVLDHLNRRFWKKIEALSVLYEVGKRINSDLGLDNMLQSIAKKTQELTGSERSLVLLINEDTESVTAKGCGYPGNHLENFTLQEMRDGVSGWVLENQEAVLILDVQEDSRCTGLAEERARQFKSKSLIVVPLCTPDQDNSKSKKVIGTLTAVNTKESPLLTQDDLVVTKALADLAIIAVENARLLEETKKRTEAMAFANKMGKLLSDAQDLMEIPRLLLEKALEEFKTEASSLALINPKTGEIEFQFALDYSGDPMANQIMREYKMSIDEGIAGAVVKRGEAIISNNVQNDSRWYRKVDSITGFATKSILAVPLIYNDDVIGVIEMLNKRDGSPFLEQEKELLSTIASSAAIAIENARLLNQERTLRKEAEALRRAYSAISASLDLKDVAGRVLDKLSKVIEYRSASLQLIQDDKRILLAGRGFEMQTADPWLARPISEDPLIERIVSSKELVILSEPSEDPNWSPMSNVRSWIGLPLVYGQKARGLVTLDHDQPGYYTQNIKNLLVQFADTAAVDLQKAYLFDIAQRRIQDLEVINEAWQAIRTKLNSEELLQTIVDQITNLLDCSHCSIFFPKRRNGDILLKPKVINGVNATQTQTRRFKPGEGLVGWVFQHGESVVLDDATRDSRFAPARKRQGRPRSMLVSPVKIANKTIGVLSADQDEYGRFSEGDRRLVDTLALQAGIAIERAAALDLLQQIGNRIISKNQTVDSILQQILTGVIEVTNTSSGVIYLVSEDERSITKSFFPPGYKHPKPRMDKKDGLTRQVIATQKEISISDIRKDPRVNPVLLEHFRSMIAMPLKLERKVIGVLYLNDEDSHDFTDTEISLLSTLCSQAAVAIESTKLFKDLETLNGQLETLSFKAFDLMSATTYPELLSKSLEILTQVLNADAALYLRQKDDLEMLKLEDCNPKNFRLRLKATCRSNDTAFSPEVQTNEKYVLEKVARSRRRKFEGLVVVQRVGTSQHPIEPFSKSDIKILDLVTAAIGYALQRLRRSWDIQPPVEKTDQKT